MYSISMMNLMKNEIVLIWFMFTQISSHVSLADIALSDKLVLYDLENQTIGWTPYNCSSSIKVRDDTSGNTYTVASHNISAAYSLSKLNAILLLVLIAVIAI